MEAVARTLALAGAIALPAAGARWAPARTRRSATGRLTPSSSPVQASQGAYQAGIAQALTFADIEYAGNVFYGVNEDGALELVS